MIVWRGLGILSPVIAWLLALGAPELMMGAGKFGDTAVATGLVVAAIANGLLGWKLNEQVSRHSLFFIPMQWWSIVMLIGAGALLFGPRT